MLIFCIFIPIQSFSQSLNKMISLTFYQIAPKQNFKKQVSVYQLCTITIFLQLSLLAIINKSKSDFLAKNSYSASLSASLDNLFVNKKFEMETCLMDKELTKVLALYAKCNYENTKKQGLKKKPL